MHKTTTIIAIDLAKNVFQVACFDKHQKLLSNRSMNRSKLILTLANHPSVLIAMEACQSAHYFADKFSSMGHMVKILPPVFVKGFVYGNKHDRNDAKAIGLAAMQPEAPIVHAKTQEQLQWQALLRIRERRVKQRTALGNQVRALLAEHGIVLNIGLQAIRAFSPTNLDESLKYIIQDLMDEFSYLDIWIANSDKHIKRVMNQHPKGKTLLALPGFGPLNTLASLIVQPNDFNNARHYSAYLGLTPKLTGTGGKVTIRGISKRGNSYHRQLLCHGARAFLTLNKNLDDPLWLWAKNIEHRRGMNVAVVALANKLAKISWHVLMGKTYQPSLAVNIA